MRKAMVVVKPSLQRRPYVTRRARISRCCMVAIPWPTTSSPAKVPHLSGGRLINCYHQQMPATSRSPDRWRRAPGLRQFATTGRSGHRGSILVGSTLYAAFANNITRFDAAGAATSVGALNGTAKVFWARNNRVPTPDIVVVDPDNGASIITASSVSSYPDADVGAPNSVCFLDGYFFFTYGDGICRASDLNATSIDPTTFIKCEGKPDGLLRALAFSDLYLAGTDSIEVWHDTAEAAPAFPFSRLKVIPKGIIGRYAVTGFEDGIGKGIVFVGNDRVVYVLNGYVPVAISTPAVIEAIEAHLAAGGDPAQIELFPYVVNGRACIVMTSSSWTWVFDLDAVEWHERASYLSSSWRATGAVKAFDKWIAGDRVSGSLVEISGLARDETGAPLVFEIESGPVAKFPARVSVAQAAFDLAQGVGEATGPDPIATDPQVAISYSDDGGFAWSAPRLRRLSRQGEVKGPIRLSKCGTTKTTGRRWPLPVPDA